MQTIHSHRRKPALARRFLHAGMPVAMALSLAALAAAGPARPATVSCPRADKPAEFAICNSETLQVLDQQLDASYRKLLGAAGSRRQQVAQEQASWIKQRDACKADMTCLAMRYQERLLDLSSHAQATPVRGFTRFARQ